MIPNSISNGVNLARILGDERVRSGVKGKRWGVGRATLPHLGRGLRGG